MTSSNSDYEHIDPEPTDADAIRSDIERTRAELADTVEQVIGKLDVKAQAADKVDAVKTAATDRVDAVKSAAGEKASQAKAAAPAPVQNVLDSIGQKAGPPTHRATEAVAPHRGKVVAGVAGGLVVLLVVRRRRRAR
jgi:non-homologous end joining protein Ku